MIWLRNGKLDSNDSNGEFQKFDQLLLLHRTRQPWIDRERDIHDSLIWMRRQHVRPDNIDDLTALSRLEKDSVGGHAMESHKARL